MKKARPIWQELPINFKKELVGYLDFRTRCSLQTCSKADYALVQKISVKIDMVTFYPPSVVLIQGWVYTMSENRLATLIIELFKNPKSSVQKVAFDFVDANPEHLSANFFMNFFNRLLDIPNFKINAEVFQWRGTEELGELFMRVLQLFISVKLEHIILSPEIPQNMVAQITETQQWKLAKKLEARGSYQTQIGWFSHFEQVTVEKMYFLSVEKAIEIVKKFQNRHLPIGSCFKIQTEFPLMRDSIMSNFTSERNDQYELMLPIPNNTNVLVVKLEPNELSGEIKSKVSIL